jgi:tetratricopeptide (TPR) repeat protein
MSQAIFNVNVEALLPLAERLPQHFDLHYQIGLGLYNSAKYDEALPYFEKAESLNSEAEIDPIKYAYCLELKPDYQKSIRLFEQANQAATQPDPWVLEHLGWCYLQIQDYSQAALYFNEVISLKPNNPWAYGKIGYCLEMEGNYQEAIEYFNTTLKKNSGEAAWINGNIGYCYQKLLNYKTALSYHLIAEGLDPYDAWNLKNIGYCYQQQKEYQLAYNYHLKAKEYLPNDIWNIKNLGYCQQQLGNYQKALDYHLQVYDLDANDTWNLGHIGYCYQQLDNYDEALVYHLRCQELDPKDDWNWGQVGYCHYVLGDLNKAQMVLEKCDDKYSYNTLGSIMLMKGLSIKATEYFKKSLFMFESKDAFFKSFNHHEYYLKKQGITDWKIETLKSELDSYAQLKPTNFN